MHKIVHTARYTDLPWEILKSTVPSGFVVETLQELSYEQLLKQVVEAEYLLVSGRLPIDERVLAAAPKLKMIQRTGVGTEMLDLQEIKKRGIPVYVNSGVNARSVAEHTLTMMLCCLKNIPQISARTKNGVWQKQKTGVSCNLLFGKTVGLVGMGAIARQVVLFLKAFGAKVVYTDIRRISPEVECQLDVSYVDSFEKLLPQVDILSFHCPLTAENHRMLTAERIALMKECASVVNTARGKLIDEDALVNALSSGKLRSAALDVHWEEPISENSQLAMLDNVIMTPHIAGLTYEAFRDMMDKAMANIEAFERNEFARLPERLKC